MSRAVSQRLPSLGTDLTTYLTEIRKFPILSQDEEATLGRRWRDRGDREAAYRLVTSHLRLVAKIAMRYRGYGLPIADVISEGNVGLMQAVKEADEAAFTMQLDGLGLAMFAPLIWMQARDYAAQGE